MKIVLDVMGGDNAPKAPIEGALDAVKQLNTEVVLCGQEEVIRAELAQMGHKELPQGISIEHAEEVVTMEDNPATAFKVKKQSSLTIGLNMVKNGQADAFVSAGNTGALLAGATLLVKRIRGIRRAALAPVVPNGGGNMVVLDCGATAEGTPEYLLQFAYMGSYYAKRFLGIDNPRVGLLNIGAEPGKGTALQKEAHALMTKAGEEGRINFIGNIEAREAITDGVDVLVTDGYSGNIFLKTLEGTAKFMSGLMKDMFMAGTKTKLAALLVKDGLRDFKKVFDASEVGGTALLGISKPVIKAHGSSDARAFYNAIRQAVTVAESGIAEDIAANIEYMKIAPAGSEGES